MDVIISSCKGLLKVLETTLLKKALGKRNENAQKRNLRCRLVTSGVCEEGCISSYGTFGVQGSPQQSQADFAAYS